MPASVSQSILCSIVCERRRTSFRIVVTVINVETSSFRPIPSYKLKNESTLQSMFAEHGSARRRGALRRAAMDFTYIFSQRGESTPIALASMRRTHPRVRARRGVSSCAGLV